MLGPAAGGRVDGCMLSQSAGTLNTTASKYYYAHLPYMPCTPTNHLAPALVCKVDLLCGLLQKEKSEKVTAMFDHPRTAVRVTFACGLINQD